MTAQISETLHYKGEVLNLCSTPLGPFLETTRHKLEMAPASTALWRGYVGAWSIEDGRLYLMSITGHVDVPNEPEYVRVGLEDFFPDVTDGVFAHWFTGELRCSMGALLKYRHMGFLSRYEQDLFIRIKRGVVLEEHTKTNGVAAPDASKDYVVSAQYSSGKSS